ncbi:unnamed protein product [Protopolystoma xenopodis]|uniref:Uncharacterized protein n=1 Tax=Protopolystoma xenopodis TaxID=117903 RepID=A0A3S4ZIW5_9PLAT|nr:unnamed protein product [Protopolystoma xenopodis]
MESTSDGGDDSGSRQEGRSSVQACASSTPRTDLVQASRRGRPASATVGAFIREPVRVTSLAEVEIGASRRGQMRRPVSAPHSTTRTTNGSSTAPTDRGRREEHDEEDGEKRRTETTASTGTRLNTTAAAEGETKVGSDAKSGPETVHVRQELTPGDYEACLLKFGWRMEIHGDPLGIK